MAEARRQMERLAAQFPVPPGVACTPTHIGGVPGEWLVPPQASPGCGIVYLHGGAYCQGSLVTHRGLGTRLALATGSSVFMVDYRLAPEHPFPAALDDAMAVCSALHREQPRFRYVLAGDSAGGGLAVAASFRMRDADLPPPAALLLVCPWLDLHALETAGPMDQVPDVTKSRKGLHRLAQLYYGTHDPRHPLISPLHGDLSTLPPTLVFAAEHDAVGPEAQRFCAKAVDQGASVECRIGREMLHVWPLFAGYLPEADEAVAGMARFVCRQLSLETAPNPRPT